jgi:hypothetical protein
MKALSMTCLLLLFFSLSFGQSASEAEQALINVEHKRLEAVSARNHEFLNNLYDETFHGIIASGHELNKVKMLEFLESYNPYVIQSIELVRARVDGTIAVTTGKLVNKSKSGSIIGQTRFMHVYLKKGDAWKMIESQGTLVIQE